MSGFQSAQRMLVLCGLRRRGPMPQWMRRARNRRVKLDACRTPYYKRSAPAPGHRRRSPMFVTFFHELKSAGRDATRLPHADGGDGHSGNALPTFRLAGNAAPLACSTADVPASRESGASLNDSRLAALFAREVATSLSASLGIGQPSPPNLASPRPRHLQFMPKSKRPPGGGPAARVRSVIGEWTIFKHSRILLGSIRPPTWLV